MEQAQVLASVQHAFDASDTECSQTDDNESIFESMDMLSPSAHTEAQTLAFMLQEQLDAINNEIRLVHRFFSFPFFPFRICYPAYKAWLQIIVKVFSRNLHHVV